MIADKQITLYNPTLKIIIAQVEIGEEYNIPDDVQVYEGSVENFRVSFPDYREEESNF